MVAKGEYERYEPTAVGVELANFADHAIELVPGIVAVGHGIIIGDIPTNDQQIRRLVRHLVEHFPSFGRQTNISAHKDLDARIGVSEFGEGFVCGLDELLAGVHGQIVEGGGGEVRK